MSLIEQIRADREKGTAGPWDNQGYHKQPTQFGVFGNGDRAVCSTGGYSDGKDNTFEDNMANARRIARVPDMEAALLAADQLINAALPYIHDHGSDLADALAAYRKAAQ